MGQGLSQQSKDILEAAAGIVEECKPITVRGVAYKLFTEGLIANMSVQSTNKVSGLVRRGREEGLISWEAIVDEGRRPRDRGVWATPNVFAGAVDDSFRLDPWEHQECRVEVWSEKGTVAGVLEPILDKYAVGFRVFKGFTSATSIMDIVTEALRDKHRPLVALYVGDWDPSGLYMSEEDLPKRLREYRRLTDGEDWNPLSIERLALVEKDLSGLPYFDVAEKSGDPRFNWYIDTMKADYATLGCACAWELDAMDPGALRARVDHAIRRHIDVEAWRRVELVEEAQRRSLRAVMDGWAALRIRGQDAE